MLSTDECHELRITGDIEPIAALGSLVRSGLFGDYVAYERSGEWAFAGGVLGEVSVDAGSVKVRWEDRVIAQERAVAPLDQVRRALRSLPVAQWRAYGFITFEMAYLNAGMPRHALQSDDLLHLVVPQTEVGIRPGWASVRSTSVDAVRAVADLLSAPTADGPWHPVPVDVEGGGDPAYRRAVAAALAEIERRRIQKVILSRSVPVPFPVDLFATYALARGHNTPARSFVLSLAGRRAAGLSPETVVEVGADGRVAAQPLAGTRAFGLGREADARLRAELVADPKEVHEHAISVKLVHDDLVAVCEPGTVHVEDFMSVKNRGSVQHLGSTVAGRLAPDRTAWDALGATFPAITAAGIPRLPAYECIAALEPRPRDLYAGTVMTASSEGEIDAALVLRTIFQRDGATWLCAGAGIVAGSTPEREFRETCEKLRSLSRFIVPVAGGSSANGRREEADVRSH